MSQARVVAGGADTLPAPYVPPIDAAEQERRHAAAIALLDRWEADEDEQDQHETMAVSRAALGTDRVAASRGLFP